MTRRTTRGARPVRPGAVSIIVEVRDIVADGLADAIAALEATGDGHELLAITGDGEAPLPDVPGWDVRRVRVPRAASWAQARNAAATAARGEYLGFLGRGVRPAPAWMRSALHACRADARVAAVVPAVRGLDGRLRYAGVTLDDAGKPCATADADRVDARDVLGAGRWASVVETRAFHWVGGYDGDCADVEDLDLGWRLWRGGMRVVFEPGSEVVLSDAPVATRDDAGLRRMVAKNLSDVEPDGGTARYPVRNVELTPLLGGLAVGTPRVLVVTPDVLAAQMAGPAIRAYELARALDGACTVELLSTVRCDLHTAPISVGLGDDARLRDAVARADVVVVQGHVLDHHPWIADSDRVVVVDAYDPIQFEVLEHSRGLSNVHRRLAVRFAQETVGRLLARGDQFLVASSKQRDLLVGQLSAAGRVNAATYDADPSLDGLVGIVPFGIPDDPPVAVHGALRSVVDGIAEDDHVVLWGGGVYNWFDPLTLVLAIDRLRVRLPTVRLFFMGMHHPHPEVPEMEMARRTRALAEELGLVGTHVFFNEGWVAYEDRAAYLLDADVGVSTHFDHVETTYSFRTRILDYLWAALPVVTTGGDAVAELVAERGFGAVVPPSDVEVLATALHRLLADPEHNAACRAAIRAAQPELTWSRAAADLVARCARPRRAADLVDPRERAIRGDRAAAALWGVGWRQSARSAVAHVRRGEWDDLSDKVRARWPARKR